MSTLENLFMQIFDRRNWIIDQLESQIDSYDQSLASNLLIHGIRPPSWLWNHVVSDPRNADAKELKKEELISGLLFPPPRLPIPLSTNRACYSKQAFKEDNGQLSETLGMETCSSNKCFIGGDASTAIPKGSINETELGQTWNRNGVPAPIPNPASYCVHVDAKISNMHFPSDPSTSNFACHSKPASKADKGQPSLSLVVETCSSSKCLATGYRSTAVCNGSINENELGQTGYTTEVPELKTTPASGRIKVDASVSEMHLEPDKSLLKFPRSRSRQKALELRNSAKAEKKGRSLKENITNDYSSRLTRSRTANEQLACVMDSPEFKNHVDSAKKPGVEVTRSRSTCYDPIRVDKSIALEEPLKCIGDVDLQQVAGPDVTILSEHAVDNGVFPSNGANDIADQRAHATEAVETKIMSNTLDASHSNCSGSKMASPNYGLYSSASRLPTDPMFLEPKQLTFIDVEECSLNQDDSPTLEEEKKRSLLEMRVLNKSPTVQQLAKEESMTKGFQLTNDFVRESCSPAQSSKQEAVSEDIEETRDFAEELVLEEILQTVEVSSGEMKALKISTSAQAEKRLDFTEVEKIVKGVSSVPFTCKTSNLSAPASKNSTAFFLNKEIHGNALANSFPSSNVIADQTEVTADVPSTSQEVVGQSSLGIQLPQAENLNLPKIAMSPQIVSSIDQERKREIDVGCTKIMLEAYELETAACDYLSKSTGTVFIDVDPRNSSILSEACETKLYDLVIDTPERSVLKQTVTPKAGQTQNQGHRNYLRSSTSLDRNPGHSKLNGSSDAMKFQKLAKTIENPCEISWPMCKRRKTDSQSNNVFNTSPRVRKARPYMQQIHENNICQALESSKDASEVVPECQQLSSSHEMDDEQLKVVIESSGLEMHQKQKCCKTEGSELSPMLQSSDSTLQESEFESEDKAQCETSPVMTSIGITIQADGYSQGYSKEVGETMSEPNSVLEVKRWSDSDDGRDLVGNRLRQENRKSSEGIMEEMKSHIGDQDSFLSYSGSTSYNANLDFIGAEKSMPEFEGFSVGVPPETVVGSGINFDDLVHLDLSSITKERTSVLDQLCRSTSVFTPLPPQSMKYKIHVTPDVCQSLPNGLLEHMNLQKTLFFNPDDGKGSEDDVQADVSGCTGSVVDASFLGRSYSDFMPSSSSFRFGWDIQRPAYTPPDGKVHHKIISKPTGYSSEKQVSLNPEFTCFRIDEDTSLDEVVDSVQEGTQNTSNKREALVDVTSEYHNSPTLVSAAGKFPYRDSIDSVNTKSDSLGIHVGVNKNLQNGYGSDRRYKTEDKENHGSSMGGNGSGKAKEFPQKRFTRSKLSEKAGEKKGSETFLERGCKHDNIVSNISSFIPLVHQKQAAAVLTGKRDIKVKSLEAAEAAKRLEEKKEIERKMRKEAAKVERAKQENMRQLELKKKEEERKKKEVEMVARKRQREEEEKKEKERKRKCIEEARKQQRENDEKLRVEKELMRRKAADEERKRKELAEGTKKQQKRDKGKEEPGCRKRTEVEPKFAAGHAKHASYIREGHEMSEVQDHAAKVVSDSGNLHKANEGGIMATEGNQEMQSYEMSPFQGSDEEDEDEDEDNHMVEKKFIPPWAR
eukprot:TRINITY_DN38718_c0_g1_i2.p1 TRINITY_DN38718_c0_g1~~TRINITY_DN38718_c0_g1_i2.p1  ORF type:complete len:1601 (+),score=400.03 TRINITY_DN38718_c0_g1_i2:221-5023(+)